MNVFDKILGEASDLAESWGGDLSIDAESVQTVLAYLVGWDYLDAAATPRSIEDAIRTLQGQAGLDVDGVPGTRTASATRLPRCGVREAFRFGAGRWGRRDLTFAATSYVDGIAIQEQDEIFRAGCDAWSSVCGLSFRQIDDPGLADLVLSVSGRRSEDFGRRHGVLAWAEMPASPSWEGQLRIKFDDAEIWRGNKSGPGTALLNVWTHELGHAIGLDHSRERGALMAPFYAPDVERPVEPDDESRAVSLYGPPLGGTKNRTNSFEIIDSRTVRFSEDVFQ